ncbi:RNA-guided endonuclease InsQ/TnpB family protein [Lacticaseibacillus jixianensis]|uniref:RNA-guided endonuclease InsQ/TnpB family protein n=1 Tax=Lacticaseibacillus jixianensis TaxID=2486012 RepID=A0ABW4BBY3_9LACO|nr:RNA-guided endonuclease TnpB family protein [Lacticaseibacillus jixianensis]
MLRTHKIRCYPNATMRRALAQACDYRRYCYNQALATWNEMYGASVVLADKTARPNERKVRDELVANKADWQYARSARILQLAVHDLALAWANFFNSKMPDHRKPRFKSKKRSRCSFKTDRAAIVNGKLRLDKPRRYRDRWYDIRLAETPRWPGALKLTSIVKEADGYYACLSIDVTPPEPLPENERICGVDANIGKFVYNNGASMAYIRGLTEQLTGLYSRVSLYQRRLARKRQANPNHFRSNNYRAAKTKLQRTYQKVTRIQGDFVQKLTTMLVRLNGTIAIEDLDALHMKMNKRLAKNLHRSLFGRFKVLMKDKAPWYGRQLVMVDRFYPSTQRCSRCGMVKTGDDKLTLAGNALHGTKHHEFHCYGCGAQLERDENAVQNLIQYAQGQAMS